MKKFVLLFVIHFFALSSFAQKGNIRGAIIDKDGIAIAGASVLIKGLKLGVVSDLEGRFTIVNIPTGSYSLTVNYFGFTTVEQRVLVQTKETTYISLVLHPIGIRLKGVEVASLGKAGQIRALNSQRGNLNVTNVVSTDQIGKFPDANIGDAVKRISGIAIQVNQGEARDIIIRGLSPELNSVMLNGSRIPSAEGDNRNIQLDLIPSDMIQTIEINKTITPDMDADALGGAVNLVTRTSPQGFRLSATLGSGLNFISNKRIWNGSFLIGNRAVNDKFGWMFSASINDNDFGSDNIEVGWADTIEYTTGEIDQIGAVVLEEVDVNPYPKILEIQPRWIQRIRRSFAANFDYRLNSNHSLFLKTMYNWRDDWENGFVFEQELMEAEEIEEEDFTVENGNLTRFPGLISRQTRGGINTNRNKNARLEDQRMQNYTLGGNHFFGGVEVDWMTSFSKASEEKKNERTAEFKSEYTVFPDISNPKFPFLNPENTSDPEDLSSFEYDEIIEENKFTKEEDLNFFINTALPLDIFNKGNGQLKIGIRGRLKSKLRENNFFVFDQEANFPTLAEVPVTSYSDANYLAGSQYQAGTFADELWLGDLILQDGNEVPDEFLGQNFTADENVFAAYLMINQKFTDQLSFIAGLRLEHTKFTASANIIEEGIGVVGRSNTVESYNNFLPGIHFKYELNPQTIIRVAWTNTLARPNYVDMVPTQQVVFSDREILLGNSGLNPATSSNIDLTGEYYFETVGIFSTAFFYKNIKNFIYTFKSTTSDDTYGVGTAGFDLFQPLNGEEASLLGIELTFQRRLDFLPGIAKNFTINMNYTYLNAKTEGIRDVNGIERDDLDLSDTPPNLFNASLGYYGKGYSARISANFSDAYITNVGGRSFEDVFYDRQLFLDFNAEIKLNEHLSIYVGLNNITDQPLRLYQGRHERTAKAEYYNRRLTFGLKYDVFKKKSEND